MREVYELIQIDFDYTENSVSSAISEKTLGMFSSIKALDEHVNNKDQIGLYYGWNQQIYPQFKIKTHFVEGV